jgi:tripartite-type tricarboxylate transporter receptor subunit TctC
MFARVPHVVAVRGDMPVKTLRDLIALAKAKPGSINFGSGGVASPLHLAGELFRTRAGIEWQHIPYRGSGPAVTALATGEVDLAAPTLPNVVSLIAAGNLRALAVMTPKRSPLLPDVPTIEEVGLTDAEAFAYYGLSAPVGTPRIALERMHEACVQAIISPDVRTRFQELGADPVGNTAAEYGEFIKTDMKKWQAVIEAAGIPKQTN